MAKGITQAQVDIAADALVVAGERPTVDRIRAFLGTGSPNTVTRMLETWWQSLGARLTSQQVRATLPGAPEAVAVLATQLWDSALEAARVEVVQALSSEADAIAARTTQLEADREALALHAATSDAAVQAADHARHLAEARLAEAQQLVQHQTVQLEDLTQQRNAARVRIEELELAQTELSERLTRQVDAASAERDALAQHVRAVEDRAYQEVDRARQDAKALQTQLAANAKEHRQHETQLREARDAAVRDVAHHQQAAAAQRARADALEQQLLRLEEATRRVTAKGSSDRSPRARAAKTSSPKRPAARKS